MSIRREPTYLSTEVHDALFLLGQAKSGTDSQGLHHFVTPDEMADTLLREVILQRYPQLFEHGKAVHKLAQDLIKTLGGKKT